MIWLAGATAFFAVVLRQFALYLEGWRVGKKICFGHIVSIDDLNHSKDAAGFLTWAPRFLGVTTIVLLIVELAMWAE